MKKHFLRIFLICAALCAVLCVTATAAYVRVRGTCGANGNNLTWQLDNAYWLSMPDWLTISGTGAMKNYSENNLPPWSNLEFSAVDIPDGVTSIGDYAFYNNETSLCIIIPSSVTSIGENAFNENAMLYVDEYSYAYEYATEHNLMTYSGEENRRMLFLAYDTGTCGDNLSWTLSYGTLAISGSGAMYNYSPSNPPPWDEYDYQIMTVQVFRDGEDPITSIGDYAFDGCVQIASIDLGFISSGGG